MDSRLPPDEQLEASIVRLKTFGPGFFLLFGLIAFALVKKT